MTEKSDKLYPRKILPELAKYLDDPGIILLVGARQVGKTSILHLLMDEVRKRGRSGKTIHYLFRFRGLRAARCVQRGREGVHRISERDGC